MKVPDHILDVLDEDPKAVEKAYLIARYDMIVANQLEREDREKREQSQPKRVGFG